MERAAEEERARQEADKVAQQAIEKARNRALMRFVDWWLELVPAARMAIVGLVTALLLIGILLLLTDAG